MQLSKSDYMLYLRHPAWLWLKKHDKSKIPPINAATQARFDAGHDFETYAEHLFPGGTRLGFDNFDEYADLPARTEKTIQGGSQHIFQGRFEHGDITCIVDVLSAAGNDEFDLTEIKSTTKVKPEHVRDLAFQLIVLEGAGYKIRNISVAFVNNEYVRHGEINPQELVSLEDITEQVREIEAETRETIPKAIAAMNSKTMPDPSPRFVDTSFDKALETWLNIYVNLNGKSDPYSIFNLAGLNAEMVGTFESRGIRTIGEIPADFHLSIRQQEQVEATRTGERIIDTPSIREFIDALQFPLYFLDFETASSTVPLFDGTRPYQQVPFQYSLHVVNEPGGAEIPREYLHLKDTSPVESLLEHLVADIGDQGSILAWSIGFEKGRNSEMGEAFPKYAALMKQFNERMIDLKNPFSKGWFTDKDFFGSASLKDVLPVLIPKLAYDDLEIQGGVTAQRVWMDAILRGKNPASRDKAIVDLKAYCERDTLAMVEIWRILNDIVSK